MPDGGVEWFLELNAKFDEATKMMRTLTKVQVAALKADQALLKASRKTGVLNRAFRTAAIGAREFVSHLGAIGVWRGLERGVMFAADLGRSMVIAAAGAERTTRSFRILFGARDADALEAAIDSIAKKTEFADDVLKATAQELGAAGFKPVQIIEALAAALDVAARTGKGHSAFEGTITALKQMQTLGKAPGRLHELGLGQGAGEAIKAEMKKGHNAVEAFFKVLEKAQGGSIGMFSLERGKDLDVTLAKLKDLPGQFGQRLAGTEAMDKLKQSALGLLEAFDPDSARGKRIFTAMETMVTRIAKMLASIDLDRVANAAIKAFEALPGIIMAATDALLLFGKAAAWLIEGTKEKQASARVFENARLAKEGQPIAQKNQFKRDAEGNFAFTDIEWFPFKRWFGIGKDEAKGLQKGIEAGMPLVASQSSKMANTATSATEKALGRHSPSRVFHDIGYDTAAGFSLGLWAGLPGVARAVGEVFDPERLMPPSVPLGGPAAPLAIAAAAGGGAAGGGDAPRFQVDITVNVEGASGDPQETADRVSDAVRRAAAAWFEQLAATGMGS